MKTSYYGQLINIPSGAICISQGVPKYADNIPQYKPLAPSWAMQKLPITPYAEAFKAQLARLDPQECWLDLQKLAGEAEPIILCYEKPVDHCHRHLVATWFEKNLNVVIPEFTFEHLTRTGMIMYEKIAQQEMI